MVTSRNFQDALEYAQAQHAHPTRDWKNWCLVFVRSSYGIPAMFGTAYAAWLGAEPEGRHPGGKPEDAPLGAALCFKGSGPNGHIDLAARLTGEVDSWSNDIVRVGKIDKVPRNAPVKAWGHRYLGYLTEVNGWDLNLRTKAPAKPKQNRRYKGLAKAIDGLEDALVGAKNTHDAADIKSLEAELKRMKNWYSKMRKV